MLVKLLQETMFDTFRIEGLWSPKKDRPLNEWNHGVLSYTPEKITLEVFDSIRPDGTGESFVDATEHFGRMFGLATTGECITLSGVLYLTGTVNFPGIPTEKYSVSDFLISNERFDEKVQSYRLHSFKFSLTYMNVWLKNEMLSIQENYHTGTHTYIVNSPERYDLAKFHYKDHNFVITMDEYGKIKNHQREVHIQNETRFDVEVEEDSISMSEAIEIAEKFAQFFTVLFGRIVSVKYLNGKTIDGLSVNLFCTPKYPINSDEDILKQRLLPMHETIADNFEKVIVAWFGMSDEMQLLVQDYLLTLTRRSVIENSLINLTQGVESYYRQTKGSLDQRLEKLIKAIPNEILDRADLKNTIDSDGQFANKLKNTRVFLTHGTTQVKVYQKRDLFIATKLLQDIVRSFILLTLGFSAEELSSIRQDLESTMGLTIIDPSLHF